MDNKTMISGVDRNASIVIDIDDKITTLEEEDNAENKLKVILLGMHSLIGETSNCATTYHNKIPQTVKQQRLYDKYIDLLSVINGKAIDSAKTGVIFNISRNIAKYGKPLPYFMKYAGDYYKRINKLLKSKSNMNRLCWDIEKWHTGVKWGKRDRNFNYKIMLNEDVIIDETISAIIEQIFLEYNKEFIQLKKDEFSIQREYRNFEMNWDAFYDKYRCMCHTVCPNGSMLANIMVRLCYEKYSKRSKGFMWHMSGDEIVNNIKQVKTMLPIRDEVNSDFKYLGKMYRLVEVSNPLKDSGNVINNELEEWGNTDFGMDI